MLINASIEVDETMGLEVLRTVWEDGPDRSGLYQRSHMITLLGITEEMRARALAAAKPDEALLAVAIGQMASGKYFSFSDTPSDEPIFYRR